MFTFHLTPNLKLKNRFSFKQFMFSWYRHYKAFFFLGFLVVLGFGGFFWYQNLYQYQWNDARKKEFLDKHFKETSFKEQSFQDVVAHLKERARLHEESVVLSRDIFSGKSLR